MMRLGHRGRCPGLSADRPKCRVACSVQGSVVKRKKERKRVIGRQLSMSPFVSWKLVTGVWMEGIVGNRRGK